MKIISRAEAKQRGLKRYYTGKPCPHGHREERRVINRSCVGCFRERYDSSPARRAQHSARLRQWSVAWEHTDQGRAAKRIKVSAQRARKRGAPGYYTAQDIYDILKRQRYRCANKKCRCDLAAYGYHVDHIIPLNKLGTSNWPSNLQCLCPTCNGSKGDRLNWQGRNDRSNYSKVSRGTRLAPG